MDIMEFSENLKALLPESVRSSLHTVRVDIDSTPLARGPYGNASHNAVNVWLIFWKPVDKSGRTNVHLGFSDSLENMPKDAPDTISWTFMNMPEEKP